MLPEIMRIKVPLRTMTLIYVNLHAVGTAIQCWSKFHWELSFKNVRFARYRGSKSTMMSSFFRGIFLFFGTYINLYTIASQFNPEQSILGNHALKIYGILKYWGQSQRWCHHIFPSMSIYVPWFLHQSKFSWDSDALF